jgi:CheY-like chemotaxis protein
MILDLMMPEVTGFDVLRELRAGTTMPELPVIILTSKILDPAERRMLERTVQAVLAKGSWNEGQFLGVIRAALMSAEQRQNHHR